MYDLYVYMYVFMRIWTDVWWRDNGGWLHADCE